MLTLLRAYIGNGTALIHTGGVLTMSQNLDLVKMQIRIQQFCVGSEMLHFEQTACETEAAW